MSHADARPIAASSAPSTGIIVARAASIVGLTLVGAALLRVPARLFEPLTVIAVTLPLTVVVAPVFVGAATVQLVLWRKRTLATGEGVRLWVRVRRLCVTWLALSAIATVAIAALTLWLAASLNITDTGGTWGIVIAIVAPMLVLGCAATAVVESVYERKTRAAAVTGA